jgi:hypothetical protein
MMLKSVVIKYLEDTILQEVKYLTDTSSLMSDILLRPFGVTRQN